MYHRSSTNEALGQMDVRAAKVRRGMARASRTQLAELWQQLDLSTIHHDWALEGQVVSPEELDAAFDNRAIADAASLPVYAALRAHRRAIDYCREIASRKKLVFTIELFRDFNALFASDPEAARSGRYRREIPLHRSYFHEICHPSKIAPNVRNLLSWLNDPEELLSQHPVHWAAKFHFRFMRIFPFAETSGKVGRTMMNMMLIRQGYLPAIIHATERQRYYEAIRQSQDDLTELVTDSARSSLDAAEKFLRRSALAS